MNLDFDKISQELKIRPEVLEKLINSFTGSLPGKMKTLEDALSQNNADVMRSVLHEIKGTAGNLRLKTISEAENKMHVAVKAGEGSDKLQAYFQELQKSVKELQDYLASKG